MLASTRNEAQITATNHALIALSAIEDQRLAKDFLGAVHLRLDPAAPPPDLARKTVYLCGDVARLKHLPLKDAARVFVIKDLARGYETGEASAFPLVDLGRVPLGIEGVGVYYRRFFDPASDHFRRICAEHTFQALTESVKPSKAHRTGIYLTPVRREGDALHFHLLRCSTNLAGPTEDFRANDREIVTALQHEADLIFENHAPLNHVLAQVYANSPADHDHKQIKAKISPHADKTKDMPADGIMAFCTFYDQLDQLSPLSSDPFDYGYKGRSGLTKLHFRLKAPVAEGAQPLPAEFTLTLYPNSVFFMPLSTNRLYTHEIQSSVLSAELLPTRLGYVVRCSKTEAVHQDGSTFLKVGGRLVPLQPPTPEGMSELRRLYAEENRTQAFIDYGDQFLFSMNQGDYLAPSCAGR